VATTLISSTFDSHCLTTPLNPIVTKKENPLLENGSS
jgi:hypothetical protein